MNIGESKIASLEAKGQTFVIQSEQVQDGSVQIMHMGPILDGVES